MHRGAIGHSVITSTKRVTRPGLVLQPRMHRYAQRALPLVVATFYADASRG